MDFAHLQSLILSLETRPDKVKVLTDYVLLNSSQCQNQVATTLYKAFNSSILDKKLAIFYTVSEILLISSQKRQIAFFKAFGNKLKPFLELLSKQVKDTAIMRDICRTLDKWQSEEMFAGNFMEKLKAVVKEFYTKIREQNNEEQQSFKFRKYKKTFLMEINDLRSTSNCYQVYQNYCQYIEIEQKLANLNIEFNKIDFDRSSENAEIHKRRCTQLLKIYNDLKEKLQKCLCGIHLSFNNVRNDALEEYAILKKEAGISTGQNLRPPNKMA